MQMIVEFFSRICARTVRMPGKIDSPGVDITNWQNDNFENPQNSERYVAVVTARFILQKRAKSWRFFLSARKNGGLLQKLPKIFVELSQISFPYEKFPAGDTGNIFIFQEGVCRAR